MDTEDTRDDEYGKQKHGLCSRPPLVMATAA